MPPLLLGGEEVTYPVLAGLKTYMGITDTDDDTLLTNILNGMIAHVERSTVRSFVAAADTKYFPVTPPWVTRRSRLNLVRQDLQAVTTLTNGDGVVVSSADYWLGPVDEPYYQVTLLNGVVWSDGGTGGRISILGSWGFSAACPADMYYAILEGAQALYNGHLQGALGEVAAASRGGLLIRPGLLPPTVYRVVQSYKRGL